jgi:outer membrane protein OmpA-like peptidoglycan-associated protein
MRKAYVRILACLTLVAILASGCETLKKPTVIGALTGTLVGAGAGAAIDRDKRGRGAAIGGVAGGLAGAGIGYYIEKQRRDLEQIPGADVSVEEVDGQQQLVVTMESTLLFETDSANISYGRDSLDQIAETLNKYPESTVIVKGYTDSRGTEEYNQQLSERRANAVRNYLIAKKVDASRITAIGFGESLPVATNDTEEGRQRNRRVEMDIIPTEAAESK